MTNKYDELFGRITLFWFEKEGKMNEPEMKGWIEGIDGKRYQVTVWSNPNEKVTKGEMLQGQVKKQSEES